MKQRKAHAGKSISEQRCAVFVSSVQASDHRVLGIYRTCDDEHDKGLYVHRAGMLNVSVLM
jgi:hypothetical protein